MTLGFGFFFGFRFGRFELLQFAERFAFGVELEDGRIFGHDFFFFTNADTERAAVVYRRDDGDVGLIDQA